MHKRQTEVTMYIYFDFKKALLYIPILMHIYLNMLSWFLYAKKTKKTAFGLKL